MGDRVTTKDVWVVAEHSESKVQEVTFEMLGEGRRLVQQVAKESVRLDELQAAAILQNLDMAAGLLWSYARNNIKEEKGESGRAKRVGEGN